MATDYARQQNSKRAKSQRRRKLSQRKRTATKARAKNNAGFNAPSFSAGVVFGAAMILVAAYAPEIFQESVTSMRGSQNEPAETVTFEFDEILENDVVLIDPDAYPADFADDPGALPQDYLLQAASFRRWEDAEQLRAELTMLNLPAKTDQVEITSGIWYRVSVGPFDSRVKAQRAMTRLRENNLSALMRKLS